MTNASDSSLPPLVTQYQSASFQATIQQPIHLRGKDGFSGQSAEVVLTPAEPESGFVFSCRRTSHSMRTLQPRYTKSRTTILVGPNDWEIMTTEHLLSALHGLGITNVNITVGDNGRIPFFDGSAHTFCAAILTAGVKIQDQFWRRHLYCQRTARLEGENGSFIELNPPSTSTMRINAAIEFQDPIGVQQFEYLHSAAAYCLHIAWARTFATKDFDSLEQVQRRLPVFELQESHGGAHVDAPMLVFKEGQYLVNLRRRDEPVRHKLADFIGDVALAGGDLHADVDLFRPGHKLNAELVHSLRNAVDQTTLPARKQPRIEGDNSEFVRDVTIPSGTAFARKARFVKMWEIRNTGRVPWRNRRLARSGPCRGAGNIESPAWVVIPDTDPGAIVTISVEAKAPDEPGSFHAEWKMVDGAGELFFPNKYGLTLAIIVE